MKQLLTLAIIAMVVAGVLAVAASAHPTRYESWGAWYSGWLAPQQGVGTAYDDPDPGAYHYCTAIDISSQRANDDSPTLPAAAPGARTTDLAVNRAESARGISRLPLPERLVTALELDPASIRSTGVHRLLSGERLELFLARSTKGRGTCLVQLGRETHGTTCAPAGFTRTPVIVSEVVHDGPDLGTASAYYLSGMVKPGVEELRLVSSNASVVEIPLSPSNVFFHEVRPEALRAGIRPLELRGYTAGGVFVGAATLRTG